MIGIIGGMGPHAGLDLARKVIEETAANSDQEHLPMALLSLPGDIVDRTAFVLGQVDVNPGSAIAQVALGLERLGATVAGMACNSAHAPIILEEVHRVLAHAGSRLRLLHLIDEAIDFLAALPVPPKRVGVLSTTSVYRLGLYRDALQRAGFEAIVPTPAEQEGVVHAAVYDPVYGVKAVSSPVHPRARANLLVAVETLAARGAEAVLLGCTEMPIALPDRCVGQLPLFDPTRILARALIREWAPDRLRPLAPSID
jgi:aspartate racemase